MAGEYSALTVKVIAMTAAMEKAIAQAATRAGQAAGKNITKPIDRATKDLGKQISTQFVGATKTMQTGMSQLGSQVGRTASRFSGSTSVMSTAIGRATQTARAMGPVFQAVGTVFSTTARTVGLASQRIGVAFAGTAQRIGQTVQSVGTRMFTTAQNIGSAIGQVSQRMGQVAGAARTALAPLTNTARDLGSTISAGMAVGGIAVGAFTASVVKSGFAFNAMYSSARLALATVLDSTKAADDLLAKVYTFSRSSPFPLESFVAATQQMIGFGVATDDVIPILSALQDAVAATTTGGEGATERFRQVVLVMNQIRSAGKVTGVDLMQFAQRGINAAELIGSAMGKTAGQIKEEITAGTLDADKALTALVTGMQVKYAGAAAALKSVWAGAENRVKASMTAIGSALAEPFLSKKGGGIALEFANKLADLFRALEPSVLPFANAIAARLMPFLKRLIGYLDSATTAAGKFKVTGASATKMVDEWAGKIKKLVTQFGPLIAIAGALSFGKLAKSLGPLGAALEMIVPGPLLAFFGAIVTTSTDVQGALKGFGKSLAYVGGELMKALGPDLGKLNKNLGKLIGEGITGLGQALVGALPGLKDFGKSLLDFMNKLIEKVIPKIGPWAADLGPKLGDLAKAFGLVVDALTKLIPMFVDFVDWLGKHSESIEDGARLFEAIAVSGVKFYNSLKNIIKIIKSFVDAIKSAKDAVDSFNEFLAVGTIGAVGALLTGFSIAREAISNGIDAIVTRFKDLAGKITGSLTKFGTKLRTMFTTAMTSVTTTVSEKIDVLVSKFTDLATRILSPLRSLGADLRAMFTATMTSVNASVAESINILVTYFANLASRILVPLMNFGTDLQNIFTSAMLSVTIAVSAGLDAVVLYFTGLWGRVSAPVSLFGANLRAAFYAAMLSISSAVAAGISRVGSLFSTLWLRIWSAIASIGPSLFTFGQQIMAKLSGGISSGLGSVSAALGGIRDSISSALRDAVDVAWDIGSAIVQGLADGIRGAVGAVLGAVAYIASQIPKTLRDLLGVGSPSKVMRDDIGRWIPAGIAEGILAHKDDVKSALSDVVDIPKVKPRPAFGLALTGAGLVGAATPANRTINVYPKENQSEMEIARQVDRILGWTAAGA